jgi:broad specificity phosphatase PhoE
LQDPAVAWQSCRSSDLPRALFTARMLFQGPIEPTPALREVPFAPVTSSPVKLPLIGWQMLSRAGWFFDHASQPEGRTQTRARVRSFLADLARTQGEGRVLLVTHGFLMQMLQAELHRSGFKGRLPWRPRFARVYVFERC